MSEIKINLNGESFVTSVEPRTSLADLIREKANLTGTHLGCEQGVCGACTIMVDDVPVRGCITTALTCSGSTVQTIEAFDDDELMRQLRGAFNAHHALQCGYCTPGMLIAARDIVRRLHDADEQRIRIELSGNLCRCTGYLGIVQAIRAVMLSRSSLKGEQFKPPSISLGPAGSAHDEIVQENISIPSKAPSPASAVSFKAGKTASKITDKSPSVKQCIKVEYPADLVWRRLADVPAMVRCIPGANLLEERDGEYHVSMRVRLGPIVAEFSGVAEQERDDITQTGAIRGSGRDKKSTSVADGVLKYKVSDDGDGATARIDLDVAYSLSGSLGQFARAGIVSSLIGEITAQFARNLQQLLSGKVEAGDPGGRNELRIAGSLFQVLFGGVITWVRRLIGRNDVPR